MVLWGRSMGAVTAILFAEKNMTEPTVHVSCLVLDSPFTKLTTMVSDVAKHKMSLPSLIATMAMGIIKGTIQTKINFDITKLEPITSAQKLNIPACFIQAKKDTLVFPERTRHYFDTYKSKKVLVQSELEHNSDREEHVLHGAFRFIDNTLGHDDLKRDQDEFNQSFFKKSVRHPGFEGSLILKRPEDFSASKREESLPLRRAARDESHQKQGVELFFKNFRIDSSPPPQTKRQSNLKIFETKQSDSFDKADQLLMGSDSLTEARIFLRNKPAKLEQSLFEENPSPMQPIVIRSQRPADRSFLHRDSLAGQYSPQLGLQLNETQQSPVVPIQRISAPASFDPRNLRQTPSSRAPPINPLRISFREFAPSSHLHQHQQNQISTAQPGAPDGRLQEGFAGATSAHQIKRIERTSSDRQEPPTQDPQDKNPIAQLHTGGPNQSQAMHQFPEPENITNSFFMSAVEERPDQGLISNRISTRGRSRSRKILPPKKQPEPEPAQDQSFFEKFKMNIIDPLMSIIEGEADRPNNPAQPTERPSLEPFLLEGHPARQLKNKSKIFDDEDGFKQLADETLKIRERSLLLDAELSPNQFRPSNSTRIQSQHFQGTAIRNENFIPKSAHTFSLDHLQHHPGSSAQTPQQPQKLRPPPPPQYAAMINSKQPPVFFGQRPPPPNLNMTSGSLRQPNPSEHQTHNSQFTFK